MKKIVLSERNRCDGRDDCSRMARKISAQENTIQVKNIEMHGICDRERVKFNFYLIWIFVFY